MLIWSQKDLPHAQKCCWKKLHFIFMKRGRCLILWTSVNTFCKCKVIFSVILLDTIFHSFVCKSFSSNQTFYVEKKNMQSFRISFVLKFRMQSSDFLQFWQKTLPRFKQGRYGSIKFQKVYYSSSPKMVFLFIFASKEPKYRFSGSIRRFR